MHIKKQDDTEMLNISREVDILALDHDEESLTGYSADTSHRIKFKSRSAMMQYELEIVSQRLIDTMSDPVDELGTFIQSLSVSDKLAVEDHIAAQINEQRQKWQKSLFENWHTSKQTKSLIPLIRFLCQILAEPDFHHILPLS